MISAFAGHSGIKYTKVDDESALKKDKSLEAKHPSLTLPYLKTSSGDIISTDSGIMGYIGRSSSGANLFGSTVFEEAKVNQWIAWAECIAPQVDHMTSMLFNPAKSADTKEFNASVDLIKKEVSSLNNALKGKKWLVGDSVTMADIACANVLTPAFQLVLDAGFRKGRADLAKWFESFIALPQVLSSAGAIKCIGKALKPFGADAGAGKAEAAPAKKNDKGGKAAKKEEDEFDDLFGDDDDDGEAAKKAA